MNPTVAPVRIGTAGWTVPRAVAERFPASGPGLGRYAAVFDAVEINTTFYRPHKPETFERWATSVPPDFRFAVKAPRAVTHERRLVEVDSLLRAFFDQVVRLGDRLGPVLVQLPPTLVFDQGRARSFLELTRTLWDGSLAVEPRHASWFDADADRLLAEHRAARVAADPARVPAAARPGGWPGLIYRRLHGSPRMYYSPYGEAVLDQLSADMRDADVETWCVFDNTASGAAAADALKLQDRLRA